MLMFFPSRLTSLLLPLLLVVSIELYYRYCWLFHRGRYPKVCVRTDVSIWCEENIYDGKRL